MTAFVVAADVLQAFVLSEQPLQEQRLLERQARVLVAALVWLELSLEVPPGVFWYQLHVFCSLHDNKSM